MVLSATPKRVLGCSILLYATLRYAIPAIIMCGICFSVFFSTFLFSSLLRQNKRAGGENNKESFLTARTNECIYISFDFLSLFLVFFYFFRDTISFFVVMLLNSCALMVYPLMMLLLHAPLKLIDTKKLNRRRRKEEEEEEMLCLHRCPVLSLSGFLELY